MQRPGKKPRFVNIDSTPCKPLPHFEQLEPRILLSADNLINAIGPAQNQDTLTESVQEVIQYAECSEINEQVKALVQSEPTKDDDYKPILTLCIDDNTNEKTADEDLNVSDIDSAQVSCNIAVFLDDSEGELQSLDTTEDGSMPFYINDSDLSKEYTTTIEIRGPPANEAVTLPGMRLVESNVDNFNGQIVYIDFDGVEDVTYDGPIVVEGIDVPEFSVPDHLTGQQQAIITNVLDALNKTFSNSGIIFTIET